MPKLTSYVSMTGKRVLVPAGPIPARCRLCDAVLTKAERVLGKTGDCRLGLCFECDWSESG